MARKMSETRHETYVTRRKAERARSMERKTARQSKAQTRIRFAA